MSRDADIRIDVVNNLEQSLGEQIRRMSLNRDYGKWGLPHFGEAYYDGGWPTPRNSIPKLEVPAAPAPEPEPQESASVQMLRKILIDRRAEMKGVEAAKASRTVQAEAAEKRAAELRSRIEQDDRHIAAAQSSIDEVLSDIAKLGGKPEAA